MTHRGTVRFTYVLYVYIIIIKYFIECMDVSRRTSIDRSVRGHLASWILQLIVVGTSRRSSRSRGPARRRPAPGGPRKRKYE